MAAVDRTDRSPEPRSPIHPAALGSALDADKGWGRANVAFRGVCKRTTLVTQYLPPCRWLPFCLCELDPPGDFIITILASILLIVGGSSSVPPPHIRNAFTHVLAVVYRPVPRWCHSALSRFYFANGLSFKTLIIV